MEGVRSQESGVRSQNTEVSIDYCGFTIEDGFVVGFGLDYDEKYRSLPGIYELV